MKSSLAARVLLPVFSVFALGQGPINRIPQEKVDEYVRIADQGAAYSSLMPGDVTKVSLFDYHGGDLQIMYSKGHSGIVSLTTAIRSDSSDVMISEQNVIDGIPERVVYVGDAEILDTTDFLKFKFSQEVVEFNDLNNQGKRKIIDKLSQAIYYVTDSLSPEQVIIPGR